MVSKRFLGVAVATCVILGAMFLTSDDDATSLAASVSVEEPLLQVKYDYFGKPYLSIQSQDEKTSINAVRVNRGNCGVELYSATGVLAYARANKDRVLFRKNEREADISFVSDGSLVKSGISLYFSDVGLSVYYNGDRSFYSNDLSGYNALDEASKAAFVPVYPVKLPYAEEFRPKINCDFSKIIEIELDVNGATFTYKMKGGDL